jgi:hypothetical protein
MDYEPFKNLPDVRSKFMTERGSTYALFGDQTSQRTEVGNNTATKPWVCNPNLLKQYLWT